MFKDQDGRLFPVEFTVEELLDVVDLVVEENNGGLLLGWEGPSFLIELLYVRFRWGVRSAAYHAPLLTDEDLQN